eukprot:753410-Hanusia_phi.AAC.9
MRASAALMGFRQRAKTGYETHAEIEISRNERLWKRVTRVQVSIVLRKALCASVVIQSASSRMTNLKGGHG